MTRIIEHRQDAAPGEEVFELRVFQLRDGDVRACVVPADFAVNLDLMAEMSEPVAQAYLDALALCETDDLRRVHGPGRPVGQRRQGVTWDRVRDRNQASLAPSDNRTSDG